MRTGNRRYNAMRTELGKYRMMRAVQTYCDAKLRERVETTWLYFCSSAKNDCIRAVLQQGPYARRP